MVLEIKFDVLPLKQTVEGAVWVGGTRVTLDTIVGAFNDGYSPEDIVSHYPSLQLADVYMVIGYYLRHRRDVDAFLQERQNQAQEIRQQNEARFNSRNIRERLVKRQSTLH